MSFKFPITPRDAASRLLAQFNPIYTMKRIDAIEDAVKELQDTLVKNSKVPSPKDKA